MERAVASRQTADKAHIFGVGFIAIWRGGQIFGFGERASLFAGSGGADLGGCDHFEGYFLNILGGGEKTLSFDTDETS